MVNLFGEGGSVYFGEHDARKLIQKGASVQWHVNIQHRNKHDRMTDNEDLSFNESSYFSSMSSCYLLSQCGATSIIELYSPYCFGRQFGFYQGITNDIRGILPIATPKSVLYRW